MVKILFNLWDKLKNLWAFCWLPISLFPFMYMTSFLAQRIMMIININYLNVLISLPDLYLDFLPLILSSTLAYKLSKTQDGSAVISGAIAYLILISVLNADVLNEAFYYMRLKVDSSCMYLENPLIGLFTGCVAAKVFNRFSDLRLPNAIAFFSGRKSVPIITTLIMIGIAPLVYVFYSIIFHAFKSIMDLFYSWNTLGLGLAASMDTFLQIIGLNDLFPSFYILTGMDQGYRYISVFLVMIVILILYQKRTIKTVFYYLFFCLAVGVFTFHFESLMYLLMICDPVCWLFLVVANGLFTILLYDGINLLVIFCTVFVILILFAHYHNNKISLQLIFPAITEADAENILDSLGGVENILEMKSESNRLKIQLIDPEFIDSKQIEESKMYQFFHKNEYYMIDFFYDEERACRIFMEKYHENLAMMKLDGEIDDENFKGL